MSGNFGLDAGNCVFSVVGAGFLLFFFFNIFELGSTVQCSYLESIHSFQGLIFTLLECVQCNL